MNRSDIFWESWWAGWMVGFGTGLFATLAFLLFMHDVLGVSFR